MPGTASSGVPPLRLGAPSSLWPSSVTADHCSPSSPWPSPTTADHCTLSSPWLSPMTTDHCTARPQVPRHPPPVGVTVRLGGGGESGRSRCFESAPIGFKKRHLKEIA